MIARTRLALLWIAVAASSGCASAARYMTEVKPPQRLTAPPGSALVIFVRPSKLAFAISANIIDEQGRFLGDTPAKGYFAAALPPGRHMFVVWAENTDALVADLLPGHTYFVEVYVTPGMWSAHMHLKAIKPQLPNWQLRDEWLQQTTQFAVDEQAGQQNLLRKGPERVQERLQKGQEEMMRYQGEPLFSRTLGPNDGV
jgi:hypothetical protein